MTIWVGVFPDITSATAAHDATQEILALLTKYQITDIEVDFCGSIYTCQVGPELLLPVGDLDPLEPNIPITSHPSKAVQNVLILGNCTLTALMELITLKGFKRQEGTNMADIDKATDSCTKAERLVAETEEMMEALQALLKQINQD
ncbi:hypothetical protein RSAG8_04807, partial [Rhizoctonia solani AG-8 WAC10335]